MNILHNRFAGLWRQDLSQNVTTKENWKRSCYSSLFFDRLLISSHVHPFTQWVEYVLPRILCEVAPVPSHNVQALHFLHFIECSWKVNGYLLVCLCYQKLRVITKPLWHKAIRNVFTQRTLTQMNVCFICSEIFYWRHENRPSLPFLTVFILGNTDSSVP